MKSLRYRLFLLGVAAAALSSGGCSEAGKLTGAVILDGKPPTLGEGDQAQLVLEQPQREAMKFPIGADGQFSGPMNDRRVAPGTYGAMLLVFSKGGGTQMIKANQQVTVAEETRSISVEFDSPKPEAKAKSKQGIPTLKPPTTTSLQTKKKVGFPQ